MISKSWRGLDVGVMGEWLGSEMMVEKEGGRTLKQASVTTQIFVEGLETTPFQNDQSILESSMHGCFHGQTT